MGEREFHNIWKQLNRKKPINKKEIDKKIKKNKENKNL